MGLLADVLSGTDVDDVKNIPAALDTRVLIVTEGDEPEYLLDLSELSDDEVFEAVQDTFSAAFGTGGDLEGVTLRPGEVVKLGVTDTTEGISYIFKGGSDQTNEDNYAQLGSPPVFTTDFTATEDVGGLSSGTQFQAGDSLETAIIKMFFKYVDPTLSLGYDSAQTVEVAATHGGDLVANWEQNDAGEAINVSYFEDGVEQGTPSNVSEPLFSSEQFTITLSRKETTRTGATYDLYVEYEEGGVQNGISGPPGPNTYNRTQQVFWRYRFWNGVDQLNGGFDLSAGSPSSSDVRGLPQTGLDVESVINQNGVDGSDSAEIAVKSGVTAQSLKIQTSGFSNTVDLSNVSIGENNFSDGTLWYRQTSVTLPDGSTTKTYNVYQWVPMPRSRVTLTLRGTSNPPF